MSSYQPSFLYEDAHVYPEVRALHDAARALTGQQICDLGVAWYLAWPCTHTERSRYDRAEDRLSAVLFKAAQTDGKGLTSNYGAAMVHEAVMRRAHDLDLIRSPEMREAHRRRSQAREPEMYLGDPIDFTAARAAGLTARALVAEPHIEPDVFAKATRVWRELLGELPR